MKAGDLKAAREWFGRAAEGGITDSQVALAEMLINARGGPPDAPAALRLCEQAAAKGHSGAMFALGAMYSGGHNIPEDRSRAAHWFRAAAELGHGQAQLMLGRYLRTGAAGTGMSVKRGIGSRVRSPKASRKRRQNWSSSLRLLHSVRCRVASDGVDMTGGKGVS
jgi:TPR repeat protein